MLISMYRILIAAILVLISVIGCGRSGDKSEVLARIGKTKITLSDFNERISNLPVRYQDVIRNRRKEFLQEIINDVLLYQEAVRQGLHKNEDVLKVVKEARKKILIARLLKDKIDDAITVSEEEISEHYDDNPSAYMLPERMRVSHILVQTREEAEGIIEELEGGASFEEIARAKSIDPTAQNGGDIGYFPKGQLIPEFESACTELAVGEISGAVKTKLGYHVIKLTDRKEAESRPLEIVKEKVKSAVYVKKRRERFNRLIKELTERTMIEINKEALEKASEDVSQKSDSPDL